MLGNFIERKLIRELFKKVSLWVLNNSCLKRTRDFFSNYSNFQTNTATILSRISTLWNTEKINCTNPTQTAPNTQHNYTRNDLNLFHSLLWWFKVKLDRTTNQCTVRFFWKTASREKEQPIYGLGVEVSAVTQIILSISFRFIFFSNKGVYTMNIKIDAVRLVSLVRGRQARVYCFGFRLSRIWRSFLMAFLCHEPFLNLKWNRSNNLFFIR